MQQQSELLQGESSALLKAANAEVKAAYLNENTKADDVVGWRLHINRRWQCCPVLFERMVLAITLDWFAERFSLRSAFDSAEQTTLFSAFTFTGAASAMLVGLVGTAERVGGSTDLNCDLGSASFSMLAE